MFEYGDDDPFEQTATITVTKDRVLLGAQSHPHEEALLSLTKEQLTDIIDALVEAEDELYKNEGL